MLEIIEYAEIMSKNQMKSFFECLKKNSQLKKSNAYLFLEQNKEVLLIDYRIFEEIQVQIFIKEQKVLNSLHKAWREKICIGCNSKMQFISTNNGDFWGCTNYRDNTNTHKTFSHDYEDVITDRLKCNQVRINANWATEILRKNSFEKFATASDLLKMYEENGLEDLRSKYGYKTTRERISGFVKGKKESVKEENEIERYLSKYFEKVKTQIGIKYKLKDHIEKVAIVDMTISEDGIIYILEIKRSPLDIIKEQLELYHSLIEFLLIKAKDTRVCNSAFLVYSSENIYFNPTHKYIRYEKLMKLNSKQAILREFQMNLYYSEEKV